MDNSALNDTFYLHFYFFFFNDTATTEISTLPLHDALPILRGGSRSRPDWICPCSKKAVARLSTWDGSPPVQSWRTDRKSTRLNSSHANISYAVFCLKKKKIWHLTSNYCIALLSVETCHKLT